MKLEFKKAHVPMDIEALIKAIAARFSQENELSFPYICHLLRKEIYRNAYAVTGGNIAKCSRVLGVHITTASRYYKKGGDA